MSRQILPKLVLPLASFLACASGCSVDNSDQAKKPNTHFQATETNSSTIQLISKPNQTLAAKISREIFNEQSPIKINIKIYKAFGIEIPKDFENKYQKLKEQVKTKLEEKQLSGITKPNFHQSIGIIKIIGDELHRQLPSPPGDPGVDTIVSALQNSEGDCDTRSLLVMTLLTEFKIQMPIKPQILPRHMVLRYAEPGKSEEFMGSYFNAEMNSGQEVKFQPDEHYNDLLENSNPQGNSTATNQDLVTSVLATLIKPLNKLDNSTDKERSLFAAITLHKLVPDNQRYRDILFSRLGSSLNDPKISTSLKNKVFEEILFLIKDTKKDQFSEAMAITYTEALKHSSQVELGINAAKYFLRTYSNSFDLNFLCGELLKEAGKKTEASKYTEVATDIVKLDLSKNLISSLDESFSKMLEDSLNNSLMTLVADKERLGDSIINYGNAKETKTSQKQKYLEAIKLLKDTLKKELEKEPDSIGLLTIKVKLDYFNKDYQSAQETLKQIEKLDPEHITDYDKEILYFLIEIKDYKSSIIFANDMSKKNPNSLDSYEAKGLLYRLQGDLPSAIKEYEQAFKLDPFKHYKTLIALYEHTNSQEQTNKTKDIARDLGIEL